MPTHETFDRTHADNPPSERSFAWIFGAFFLLLGFWPIWRGRPIRWWWIAASALTFTIGILRPSLLRTANLLWFRLGGMLNRVTSPIIMSLLFFAVFTPIGAILRMSGKDPLRLRRDPDARSYWIHRDPPGPQPAGMIEQF